MMYAAGSGVRKKKGCPAGLAWARRRVQSWTVQVEEQRGGMQSYAGALI